MSQGKIGSTSSANSARAGLATCRPRRSSTCGTLGAPPGARSPGRLGRRPGEPPRARETPFATFEDDPANPLDPHMLPPRTGPLTRRPPPWDRPRQPTNPAIAS